MVVSQCEDPTPAPPLSRAAPFSMVPVTLNPRAQALVASRIENSTSKAYAGAWKRYERWCTENGNLRPILDNKLEMAIQLCNFVADEQFALDLVGTTPRFPSPV